MPQNEAAAIDPLAGGSFSRLLFSDEDALRHHPDNTNDGNFTFPNQKPPKMLCFGADHYINNGLSTTTADDNNNSSSPSSTTNSTTTSLSSNNSNMKRNMGCDYYQPVVLPTSYATTGATIAPGRSTSTTRNCKKMKAEKTPPVSHAKAKKEKLGERIAALQQIVSPYGKTDTASVLHEAMGYIKFLQEQVQVLCSPYLQLPQSIHIEGKEDGGGSGSGERRKKELGSRGLGSRGLCLVPVEWTIHVAESNGADLWSPAMVNRHNSSIPH